MIFRLDFSWSAGVHLRSEGLSAAGTKGWRRILQNEVSFPASAEVRGFPAVRGSRGRAPSSRFVSGHLGPAPPSRPSAPPPRAAHRLRRSRYRGNRGADCAPAGIGSPRHFQTVLAPEPESGAEGASEGGEARGAMRPQAEEAAAGAAGECRCGGGRSGRGGRALAVASREVPAGRARVLPGGMPRGRGRKCGPAGRGAATPLRIHVRHPCPSTPGSEAAARRSTRGSSSVPVSFRAARRGRLCGVHTRLLPADGLI